MSEEVVIPLARLNRQIREIVENETRDKPFWTGGIVSGIYLAESGNTYFYLEDGNFSIRCILREHIMSSTSFTPQNEMDVEVYGPLAIYEEQARVQIEVQRMRFLEGNFEPVINRLKSSGLYPVKQRTIPKNPRQIVLITSRSSEADSDFRKYYNEAGGKSQIRLVDVRLEGEGAPKQIADAINEVNQKQLGDVIVLTRGGGRRHALTAFDDFLIAEAICRSRIPVVTAIGHVRDSTIADEVADVSKGTPTAAATYLAQVQQTPNSAITILLVAVGLFLVIGVIIMLVLLLSG